MSMFIVKLGTESVAANAVSNSALMVLYSMGLAVSNLSVTIIGQCIGENGMAWRGVHFSVTGSIAAVFTDHFKIISGTGKYIRPDLYAARNCVCTDGTALVNVECTAECTSGCRRCEFYIVCVIDHNVVDPRGL